MKQVIVGEFYCGFERVQLVLREGLGGQFYTSPGEHQLARIKVGAQEDGRKWGFVVACLLHEILEFAMFRADARFTPDNRNEPKSHADYLFVADHQKFTDYTNKAAEFLTDALPPLATAYQKWHRKRKRKNGRR